MISRPFPLSGPEAWPIAAAPEDWTAGLGVAADSSRMAHLSTGAACHAAGSGTWCCGRNKLTPFSAAVSTQTLRRTLGCSGAEDESVALVVDELARGAQSPAQYSACGADRRLTLCLEPADERLELGFGRLDDRHDWERRGPNHDRRWARVFSRCSSWSRAELTTGATTYQACRPADNRNASDKS